MSKSGIEREIFCSVDIETDGRVPGLSSMLSFGTAAFSWDGKLLSTFSANLELLSGATPDSETMEWWKTQPEAWGKCRENLQMPEKAMKDYVRWLKELPGKPVFVGYPAGFDFTFMYSYLIRFANESPFGFQALDIKSYAMALMQTGFKDTVKKNMPKEWFPENSHTHVALDDAIEQGKLFINMLQYNLRQQGEFHHKSPWFNRPTPEMQEARKKLCEEFEKEYGPITEEELKAIEREWLE